MTMKDYLKNTVTSLLLVLLFVVSVTAVSAGGSNETAAGLDQAKVIRVGFQASSSNAYFLNKAFGFYEKEFGPDGIEVKFEQFSYGPPIIEGLAAGSLDFGGVGDMPVVTAVANGLPIRSIYKVGINPNSNTLLVPVNSSVTKADQLKGKKVGTSIGSSGHHFLVLLLNQAGLTVDDVEIVNLSATDLGTALASEQVAAGSTWEPYGTIFTGNKSGKIIIKSKGIKQNTSTEVASTEFIEKNPGLTARYLKVLLEIEDYVQQDRARAIKIIAEQSGFKESDLAGIYENTYDPHFTEFDRQQLDATKKFLLSADLIKKDYDITTLYTEKYLVEAEKLFKAAKK
jgi:sulfonate transport system substrate-binding protein